VDDTAGAAGWVSAKCATSSQGKQSVLGGEVLGDEGGCREVVGL